MAEAVIDSQLAEYLAACAQTVDRELRRTLTRELPGESLMHRVIAYHLGWADPRFELHPHRDSERSHGKKLRPALAMLCFDAIRDLPGFWRKPSTETATAFAVAVELLHNYSLVHDDIQDASHLRRGQPALWTLCGSNLAINAGDCLQALAYLRLACLDLDAVDGEVARELLVILSRAAVDLTVGQGLDLMLEDAGEVDVDSYLRMISRKTAALMRCATEGGALVALGGRRRAAGGILGEVAEFGREFGLCFQIRDDWLGIWGAEEQTGKSASADLRQRKKTLPVVVAFERSAPPARRRMRELYAQPTELDDDQQAEVRRILEDCEAAKLTQHHAEMHGRRAMQALTRAAGGPQQLRESRHLAMLDELTAFVSARTR